MGRPGDGEPSGIEFLDVGVPPSTPIGRQASRRWRRWVGLLVAMLAIALLIATVTRGNNTPSAAPPTDRSPGGTSSASAVPLNPAPAPAISVHETAVGHRLLGVTAGWELFGRGDAVAVRIQLAAGRITTTLVPQLISTGPVSFIVGAHSALVRSSGGAPAYLIPDGEPARGLAMPDYAGPAVPGPTSDDVWLPSFGQLRQRMTLVKITGRSTGISIPVPAGSSVHQASSDATGYPIFAGIGGTFDTGPNGPRRVTTGTVLAVGPTRWLLRECDARDTCVTVVVNRSTGARHDLSDIGSDTISAPIGVISPDGTTAAMIDTSDENHDVHIRDLISGANYRLPVTTDLATALNVGSMVWSPDSRWLFLVAAQGRLAVFDTRTHRIRNIGTPLPNLSQLAIRSAPRG